MISVTVARFAGAMILIAQPGLAHASKADFASCDGLRPPPAKGDGMADPAPDIRGFSGFGRPNGVNWTGQIAACERALADPKLLPSHILRKVNLLRARALGYFGNEEHDKALAEIDAAEIAGKGLEADPLYARSMGISFSMIRAAVWAAKGDTAKAVSFAQTAADARPYSNGVQSVVTSILRQTDIETAGETLAFARLLPLSPDALYGQSSYLFDNSRFQSVAKRFGRLKTEFPTTRNTVIFEDTLPPDVGTLIRSLFASFQGAYAFAASRDPARARAILADTRSKFDEAMKPPAASAGTTAAPTSNQLDDALKSVVAQWTMLIEARAAIEENRASDALKAIVGQALPTNNVGVDLLTALRKALPEAQRNLAPDPEALKQKIDEKQKPNRFDVTAFQRALPAAESRNRAADYKKASTPVLRKLLLIGASSNAYSPNGFKSKLDPATGITTVEYLGSDASAAVVEELTLLHAADLARQQGKPALLIVDRRDFSRRLTTSQYGSPISSRPAGFKTEIDVKFVDPANAPAALASERDRLLSADKVYAALAPIYIPAP